MTDSFEDTLRESLRDYMGDSPAARSMFAGECPPTRVCRDRADLGNWFKQFAFAARAARPKVAP